MVTNTQTNIEHELCPICKNGMTCEKLISHVKFWDTEKN